MATLLLGSLIGQAGAIGPGGWDHVGDAGTAGKPSLNGPVYALNTDRPGTLYVGGEFTDAGGAPDADRIASWNGSAWSAVSSPASQISNGAVNAIAYDAATGHIFAGGTFTNAGGDANADFLAEWNGTSWGTFCNGSSPPITATVYALQIIGRTLYVGGSFANGAGIASGDRLIGCNLDTGAASSTVIDAAHEFNVSVNALAADSNGNLYAGGGFINLSEIPAADHVAYMDGTGWHAMGSGGGACSCAVDEFVRSLTAIGTDVYVGTDSKDVAGLPLADHVVRWNGSAWSAVGSNTAATDGWFPTSAFINGMANDGTNVYAIGSFQNADGDPTADSVAAFRGGAWHPVGSDGSGNGPWIGNGLALAVFGGELYAGGNFTSAGGDTQAHGIACYQLGATPCTPAPSAPPASPPVLAPAAAQKLAGNFTVSPQVTCLGAACATILLKATFESDGNLIAEQVLPGQGAARDALASKRKSKPLIKKLNKAVSAGANTLKLKLTAAGKKKLKKGSLQVKVRFTFTPTGGTAKSQVRTLAVKLPAK